MIVWLVVVVLLSAFSPSPVAQLSVAQPAPDFQVGIGSYELGDYKAALYHFRPLAEKGDVRAQLYLGMIYRVEIEICSRIFSSKRRNECVYTSISALCS